ncbi:MAG: LysR family transcriptional regulator [Myxococcota bacterium]
MTLDGLRALLEVMDAGSINRAATRLGVPRTTLTRRLDALETWFGTTLLTVSRDGAQPTAAGLRLARGAEVLLRQATALDTSVRLGLETPTRPIQLAVPPGLHPTQMAMAIEHFRQRVPGVQLNIRTQADPFIHDADGYPDVILSFGRPRLGEYRIFQLIRMRFALRASSAYLTRHGTPTSIEDLQSHMLWVWEGALVSSKAGHGVLLQDKTLLPISPAVVVNDLHQVHIALQRGLCLAIVPSAPFDAIEPDEIEVMEGTLGGDIGLWVAVPERNVDLPWTRRMLAELRDLIRFIGAMDAKLDDER